MWTITGAGGLIGSHLTRLLDHEGIEWQSLPHRILGPRVPVGDTVVHLAGLTDLRACEADPTACEAANLHLALAVLQAARSKEAHCIIPSSIRALGTPCHNAKEDSQRDPFDAYGRAKAQLEEYAQGATILRVSSVYAHEGRGIISAFRHGASRGRIRIMGDGSSNKDMVHAEDVARAILHAAKNPIPLVNVGGTHTTVAAIADWFRDRTGCRVGHTDPDPLDVDGWLNPDKAREWGYTPHHDVFDDLDRWVQ